MPFGVSLPLERATSTPYFFAKPAAAGVGSPSGANAAATGGPVTSSSKSVCRSASLATRDGQTPRRAVALGRRAGGRRNSFSRASSWRASWAVRSGSQPAGISSHPISISSSRSIGTQSSSAGHSDVAARIAVELVVPALFHRSVRKALDTLGRRLSLVSASARHRPSQCATGELTDAQDVGRALGDADAAARIENVEQVRALQTVLERRQDRARMQQPFREAVVLRRTDRDGAPQTASAACSTWPNAYLDCSISSCSRTSPYFTPAAPLEVEHVVDPLQEHGDALEPVGDLARDRRQVDAADLLEVRELRDLEAVEQHLPADAPRAERRRLPVVLLEADVVLPRVDAARLETLEIDLLHFVGRRLEDHLVLVVLEQPVRVLAESPVVRPSRRLDVGDAPGLRVRARGRASRDARCPAPTSRSSGCCSRQPCEAQNAESLRMRSWKVTRVYRPALRVAATGREAPDPTSTSSPDAS